MRVIWRVVMDDATHSETCAHERDRIPCARCRLLAAEPARSRLGGSLALFLLLACFVKHVLTVLLCLLAGCAIQPRPADQANAAETAARARPMPPTGPLLRIGVEHLGEADALARTAEIPRPEPIADDTADARAVVRPAPDARRAGDARETRHLWLMANEDFAAIDEPVARQTLTFVFDLLGEDNRRIRREVGTPILSAHYEDLGAPNLPTRFDEQVAEEQEEALAEHGARLLKRPLRNLLRRTELVEDLELHVEDFRADHVPLSAPYRDTHPERRSLGRLSMRLRVDDLHDPVEISYVRSGVRVGTGQEHYKIGFTRWLARDLSVGLHSRCSYETGSWRLRGDLTWYASDHTSLHLLFGDDLDFLDTSSVYSLFETPMDGSPGVLLHAVHLF